VGQTCQFDSQTPNSNAAHTTKCLLSGVYAISPLLRSQGRHVVDRSNPAITMGISALKLIDRSGKQETVGPCYVATSADSAEDGNTAGCKLLCEMLGVEQHIGRQTLLFGSAAEGSIRVLHRYLANTSDLSTLVDGAPQQFTTEGSTLTLWYSMPTVATPRGEDPVAAKSHKQDKKRKQQSSAADEGPDKKQKSKQQLQQSQGASSTKLPHNVTSELYARAAVVMPRSKNGAFLPVEGGVVGWRNWLVLEVLQWCKDNGINDISSDSLSNAVTS
jgi:hypothetical protein